MSALDLVDDLSRRDSWGSQTTVVGPGLLERYFSRPLDVIGGVVLDIHIGQITDRSSIPTS